jgi:hypothetical protein
MYNILNKNMTLEDDFGAWWDLPKYRNTDIEAKKFSDVRIVRRNASYKNWPGPERDVEYWVELENGFAVGMVHRKGASGTRRKKYAEFPIVKMPK